MAAQAVKKLPAVQETWVPSLGQEGQEWQPTPVFLPGESQGQEEPGGLYRITFPSEDL